jgi:transaldolase
MSSNPAVSSLRVKIFADGADKTAILDFYTKPWIRGFTTNPTLMRRAGISNYEAFARDILAAIPDRPISFEVFADEFAEMDRQARLIASWADNVYIKIPVTNTRRDPSWNLVHRLSHSGIKLNVTALLTLGQVRETARALAGGAPSAISVFAGRIADTGRDPLPVMAEAVEILHETGGIELIWASPRELLNILQADQTGCDIITVTGDILKKIDLLGRDLGDLSLDTVKMFYADARQSGFQL